MWNRLRRTWSRHDGRVCSQEGECRGHRWTYRCRHCNWRGVIQGLKNVALGCATLFGLLKSIVHPAHLQSSVYFKWLICLTENSNFTVFGAVGETASENQLIFLYTLIIFIHWINRKVVCFIFFMHKFYKNL